MNWEKNAISEKCIGSPTKQKRRNDQLELMKQLKIKQETLFLQKMNKLNAQLSRKERYKQQANMKVKFNLIIQIEFKSNLKQNKKGSLDLDFDSDNQTSSLQPSPMMVPSLPIMLKSNQSFTNIYPAITIDETQNLSNLDNSSNNSDLRIKSLTYTAGIHKKISEFQQQPINFQHSHKNQISSERDSTDYFQKLSTQNENIERCNQERLYTQKTDSFSLSKHDDKFSQDKNLAVAQSQADFKIQKNDEITSKYLRGSHMLDYGNGDQNAKTRRFTQCSVNSGLSNNIYENSTRETSLRDIPSVNVITANLIQSKQFIIKTTSQQSLLKTSKSLQPISNQVDNSSQSYQIGALTSKSSRKSSDKIDYFSDLYQIAENQCDTIDKSSENQSLKSQSDIEEIENSQNSKNERKRFLLQNLQGEKQQNYKYSYYISSPQSPLETDKIGIDSLNSKQSIKNITFNQQEKQVIDEVDKRDSKTELLNAQSINSSPNRKMSIREQVKLKRKQTLEYLDEDYQSKNKSLTNFIKEKGNKDEILEVNDFTYGNNMHGEVFSPSEEVALKNVQNKNQPILQRKSTLSLISDQYSSMSQNHLKQRSFLKHSNAMIRRQSQKLENIFNLISFEDKLVTRLYEFIEGNNKIQKTIQLVCKVSTQEFSNQCEMVISSTIHDNIHGKVQKILADSSLKEKISNEFRECLQNSHFDNQALNIFQSQFNMKWNNFFTNINLLEEMGGVEQLRLVVWNCFQKLEKKLSFQFNPGACSSACIRFLASLLTDNQSAIEYYMSKLNEITLVTQMDFFLIKNALYKSLYHLSILDMGDLNFIIEKLENCRAYLFPQDYLKCKDMMRIMAESFHKSKIIQNPENQYFISKEYNVITLIIESITKLINYEVNVDDCISILKPLLKKPLDDQFFSELLKIFRIFLANLDYAIMPHINHLLNRLKLKLNQQNTSLPFNFVLLEVEQDQILQDMEDWLENYFKDEDLNNLNDIFDFRYIKFILSFAMDQREIFQIQDSISAKSFYKPTQDAIKYQIQALRQVLYSKLDKHFENKFKSRRNSQQISMVFLQNQQSQILGRSSFQSMQFDLQNGSLIKNQQTASNIAIQTNQQNKEESNLSEQEQKRRNQYQHLNQLLTYLRQCTDV
ncbi:hypothetical protein TTHERM_00101400 (macronuclear) [Tetrahymena thermophila SB210]|uniref:Uncharacterized protein n=1 Tax=Tetrahymena thermophila (strain SB210) TaxID=312017 RepID=Q234Q9_TETTS|nr:hypothetical protein TTHERM_00101400 [Tetrahymena thermophila SB210]EAR91944.2 hypothetical protein TTHERM_00101400 [Tetrahymena thermophila SB210]|eukprot:XP_001012189.2 hypothetical protein TTHERM_00101400 [Tetrahymena thermophila SB210]